MATAAGIGSVIDWYDFYLSSIAAALVWPNLYFKFLSGPAALGLAIATVAVTFITRPLGAFLFGHLGDKRGRKTTLVWTLVTSGIADLGIALTPGYAVIGFLAPFLLVLFRTVFGIGIGGEFGGAQTWITEYASKSGRRGFWNGLVYVSNPVGIVASSLSFTVTLIITGHAFFDWGWRIPFIAGGVVVAVGAIIRYTMQESPLFTELLEKRAVQRAPALEVLRTNWKKILLLSGAQVHAVGSGLIISNGPFQIGYLNAVTHNPTFVTIAVAAGTAVSAFVMVLGGLLSDTIGRRKTVFFSALLTAIFAFPAYLMINTLNPALIVLSEAMVISAVFLDGGAVSALLVEQFPTRYRYSGSGLAFQLAGLVAGLVLGFIVSPIVGITGGPLKAWPYAAGIAVVLNVISMIALLFIRETRGAELEL